LCIKNSQWEETLEHTAVFMLVDHIMDVACKVPTRFWLWWCSSSIWKPL